MKTNNPDRRLQPDHTNLDNDRAQPANHTPIPSFTIPPIPVNPPTQGSQAATESVVYEVGGRGSALNVTYFDASGSLQMEFNVKLPWRKEVKLNTEQVTNAVVIAADFSHDVSCTLLVNGAQKSATSGKMATCSTLG